MPRHRRTIFDPDYRRKGWNRSRYAPKNGGMSITRYSAFLTVLVLVLLYLPAQRLWQGWAYQEVLNSRGRLDYRQLQDQWTTIAIILLPMVFFIVQMIIALFLRGREWRRIQTTRDDSHVPDDAPPPKRLHPLEEAPLPHYPTAQASIGQSEPLQDLIQWQLDDRRHRLQGAAGQTGTISPREFEHKVAWMINATTRYKAITTGGSGDGGVDVKVYDGTKLVGIVQCKHYPGKTLPPSFVRELFAVKHQYGVKFAYLATTGHFSDQTRAEAQRLEIRLIDERDIERIERKAHDATRPPSGERASR